MSLGHLSMLINKKFLCDDFDKNSYNTDISNKHNRYKKSKGLGTQSMID